MIKKQWQLAKFKDKTGGGLTAAGVAQYRKENPKSNLKTGVDKTPTTPEQIRRQGLFLTRTFGRFRKTGSKIKNPPPLVKKFKTKPDEPSRIALSACLLYNTEVCLSDGTNKTIQEIVENKLNVEVLSYNIDQQKIENKKIVNWFEYKSNRNEYVTIGNLSFSKKFSNSQKKMLTCTEDHKIYTSLGYIPAIDCLKKSRAVLTLEPDYNMMCALYGTLLGDSSFQKVCNKGVRESTYVSCAHGPKQVKYLEFKKELLKANEIISRPILCSNGVETSGNFMTTISLPFFYQLREKWINSNGSGKKGIPDDLSEYFTELTFAIWLFDDGHLYGTNSNRYGYKIHTECFTKKEVEYLSDLINKTFGIQSYPYKRTDGGNEFFHYYIIKIGHRKDVEIISKILSKYATNDMLYKLLPNDRINQIPVAVETNFINTICYSKITTISEPSGIKGKDKASMYKYKYDIEVEDNHNFFANNTLVHNSKWNSPVPKTVAQARSLYQKGLGLLKRLKK